jgi:phosphate starvation-inducible PhoH-like protein
MAIPRTIAQNVYLKALRNSVKPIVVATGPAGSGKTLMACHAAAERLHAKQVDRVIITRPTVTVDEELGFLPGGLEEKMDPYMRPIMDIMGNYFTRSRIQKMMKDGVFEIAPLAFMRGRTFDKSFIIGDEMQNTTQGQMKMILTRLGEDSKMAITGDMSQTDLPSKTTSGLLDLVTSIKAVDELTYIQHIVLGDEDIQRHEAVREVLELYDNGGYQG